MKEECNSNNLEGGEAPTAVRPSRSDSASGVLQLIASFTQLHQMSDALRIGTRKSEVRQSSWQFVVDC